MGKLFYRYGVMGSAKSLNLLTTAYNFEEKGISFLILKPAVDNRSAVGFIASRIEGMTRPCIDLKTDDNIYQSIKTFVDCQISAMQELPKWILVDESQFLTEIQVDQLSLCADKFNINIICYGLRTDFRSKLFPGSKRLMEIADKIEEIKSSCHCGNKAIINARISSDGKVLSSGEQILIGGNDKYVSLCRKCWRKAIGQYPGKEEDNE